MLFSPNYCRFYNNNARNIEHIKSLVIIEIPQFEKECLFSDNLICTCCNSLALRHLCRSANEIGLYQLTEAAFSFSTICGSLGQDLATRSSDDGRSF